MIDAVQSSGPKPSDMFDSDMIRGSPMLFYVHIMLGHKQSALSCSRHPCFSFLFFFLQAH